MAALPGEHPLNRSVYGVRWTENVYKTSAIPAEHQRELPSLRDGVFLEGRIAILPSKCEREFTSREAYINGKQFPRSSAGTADKTYPLSVFTLRLIRPGSLWPCVRTISVPTLAHGDQLPESLPQCLQRVRECALTLLR
jgi:hypothetical protein